SPAALEAYSTLWGIAEKTGFTPQERNIVYLAIIYENECTYCMAGHTNLSRMAKVDNAAIAAVREGRPIADAKLEALHQFAAKVTRQRGVVSQADVAAFKAAGYDNRAILNMAVSPFVLILRGSGLLTEDLDYHLVRASMVIMFFFFGYQKWWPYEAERLVPFISNGPLIWWLYPVFGHQGASWFLGVFEWTFGALLLAGFWDKRLGILGAAGSTATFIATVTIIPFMPDGWDAAAGFPAMTGNVPFLMKDVVLLAVSLYLLKQDVVRMLSARDAEMVSSPLRTHGIAAAAVTSLTARPNT